MGTAAVELCADRRAGSAAGVAELEREPERSSGLNPFVFVFSDDLSVWELYRFDFSEEEYRERKAAFHAENLRRKQAGISTDGKHMNGDWAFECFKRGRGSKEALAAGKYLASLTEWEKQ